jgi:hypothetical protein
MTPMIVPVQEQIEPDPENCPCGNESTVGVHVIDNDQVINTYFCDDHWNRKIDHIVDVEADEE